MFKSYYKYSIIFLGHQSSAWSPVLHITYLRTFLFLQSGFARSSLHGQ